MNVSRSIGRELTILSEELSSPNQQIVISLFNNINKYLVRNRIDRYIKRGDDRSKESWFIIFTPDDQTFTEEDKSIIMRHGYSEETEITLHHVKFSERELKFMLQGDYSFLKLVIEEMRKSVPNNAPQIEEQIIIDETELDDSFPSIEIVHLN
ncbi:hypothetical protein UB51_03915 [Paenibacillus sp. IHBB 10380]|nr:hypothetical protein UB51_03915 [Paenibacillus sp. IHBB 10380]